MGYGSYTASDWSKLKKSRSLDSKTDASQIFTQNKMLDKFNPRFINKRESRDSEDHPLSTPIAIGVDVTGSMGYLSTQIIKESLNALMIELYGSNIIPDPQLMFAALGDVVDNAPLQVTQFESDIRIAEQLMDLWIEGRGGDAPEDYQLLWYFLAHHTDIDSFNKREKKGICITIGDAGIHSEVSARNINRIFDEEVDGPLSSVELAKAASQKYELIHIIIGEKPNNLTEIIPGRVLLIKKGNVQYLTDVIVTVLRILNGETKEKALNKLNALSKPVVEQALTLFCVGADNTITL